MAITVQETEQELQRSIQAARDAGVSEEMISNIARITPEAEELPGPDVQEAVEVQQAVPVGEEFAVDFSGVPKESAISENVVSALSQSTPITNPWVKRVTGEKVNDPVIYNSKLNKVTAYEMQINGTEFMEARSKAEVALSNNDLDTVLLEYKVKIAEQMEVDWREFLKNAEPEQIVSYAEFRKQHSLVEAYEGKLGEERLFVDTFSGLTLDEEKEANSVIQGYANQLLQERVDTVDAIDWGVSALGLFVPDYLKDVNDLVDSGLFDTKETYFNFIEGFKQSTVDQKARILDVYVPKVWAAFDENPIKASGAINVLFDEGHETSFWIDAGFDFADFTGIGFDVFKLGAGGLATVKLLRGMKANKKLNSMTNIKMKYRDVENPNAATEVTAASRADETGTVQKGNNQTEADEAADVSGVSTENSTVTGNSIDGLADAHTRLFEQVKYNRTGTPFQRNFLSQLDRNRLEGLLRGQRALQRRHGSNVTSLKAKLSTEPKPKVREVSPDEAARLLTEGWKEHSRVEGTVRMVQASARVQRMQTELGKEAVKLEQASETVREIQDQLRFADIRAVSVDDELAMARGEVPKGAEDYVQAETEALGTLYKGLTKNAAEAVKAGLDRAVAQAIVQDIRGKTARLTETLEQIMPEMLTAAEKAAVEKAAIEKIQKAAEDSGRVIKGVEIIDKDRKGFKAKITYENGSDVETVRFTENDLGDMGVDRGDINASLVNTWGAKIFSPEHQFDAADKTGRFGGLVRDATFAGDQASRVKRALNAMARSTTQGLSRKQRNQLDRLVLASDEASNELERLFTIKELQEGVETAKGLEIIDQDVIDSYFKMHLYLGEVKRLMNWSVRRSLEVKGFKNLSFVDKGSLKQSIIKPVQNWGTWQPSPKSKVLVYDQEAGAWTSKISAEIVQQQQELKNQGYQLVEFFSKATDADGTITSHAVIPPNPKVGQIGDLPEEVLNSTKGMYIPRVYRAGYYYVRDAGDARKHTVLAFERRTDAEAYTARKNAEGKKYQWFQDGDMGYEDSLIALAQGYGGLYTSARKRENLKMVAAGQDPETSLTRPERLGGISSIQRYLDATGNMMPLAEQRIAAVRRFENQLNSVAKTFGFERGLETPGDFNSKILLPENSAEKALFENMREYIKGSYGTLSNQEKGFQGMMTTVAEYMEKGFDIPVIGGITESARKFAVNTAHADIRSKLLGATFDAHLGWFNASQLYVQSQNAALAMSMHPVAGVKAVPQAFAARSIILTSNEPQLGELADVVTKGMGFNREEFIDSVRAFRKTGLYDSVMRVADYGGKAAGVGGTALDRFRQGMKMGRVFYEEGEMMSRLTSFFIAKETLKAKAKKAGKAFDIKSDSAIKELSDETYRIMMNMQRENAAWWQKNWFGVPLQFAQVQAKLIENILPVALGGSARWTPAEKLKVLTGQVLLYGAVGVPLIEQVTNYMHGALGVDPAELKEENPQVLEFIQEGFTGVISQALGLQNNFSERGSIIKGLDDNAVAGLVKGVYRTLKYKDDEVNLSDYLGASLNTFYRTKEAADQLVSSIDNLFYKPTGQVFANELLNVSDSFASITSTWSNRNKGKFLHSIGMQSGNGNLMIPASEFNTNYISQVARMMGFPLDKEIAFYNTFEAQQAHKRDWTYVRNSLKQRMMQQMQSPSDRDIYQRDMNALSMPLTEYERDKMMETIIQEITSGKSGFDKQMMQQLRLYMSGAIEQTPVQEIE